MTFAKSYATISCASASTSEPRTTAEAVCPRSAASFCPAAIASNDVLFNVPALCSMKTRIPLLMIDEEDLLRIEFFQGLNAFTVVDKSLKGRILPRVRHFLTFDYTRFVLKCLTKIGNRLIHVAHFSVSARHVVVEHRILWILRQSILKGLFGFFQITGEAIRHSKIVDQDSPKSFVEHALLLLKIQRFLVAGNGVFIVFIQIERACLLHISQRLRVRMLLGCRPAAKTEQGNYD